MSGGGVHIARLAGAGDDGIFSLENSVPGYWSRSQARAREQVRLAAIVTGPIMHLIFMVHMPQFLTEIGAPRSQSRPVSDHVPVGALDIAPVVT